MKKNIENDPRGRNDGTTELPVFDRNNRSGKVQQIGDVLKQIMADWPRKHHAVNKVHSGSSRKHHAVRRGDVNGDNIDKS